MRIFGHLVFLFLIAPLAWAQVDPSSELLLTPSGEEVTDPTGLESGRYEVKGPKKKSEAPVVQSKKIQKHSLRRKPVLGDEVSGESLDHSKQVGSAEQNSGKSGKPKKRSASTEVGKLLFSEPAPVRDIASETEVEEANETKVEVQEPSVADQIRNLISGENQTFIESYKEQIHPDDVRLNRLEINVLPGVLSNSSRSSYWYRDYKTFSPKLSLGAYFWMTPFIGIHGSYTTSLGGDVESNPATSSHSLAQHEWTEVGLDFRKYFGMSRKSNSLTYGFHLSEYKFTVPGDDSHRIRLRSTGLGVHFMTRVPVAPSYAWTLGGKLIPRVQHTELETGIDVSSGSHGESSRIDLIVGGEFKLARQNQIIWDLTGSFEKNQYNGQANQVDPKTGTTPNGVSVENTFLLFSLGYRWGQ